MERRQAVLRALAYAGQEAYTGWPSNHLDTPGDYLQAIEERYDMRLIPHSVPNAEEDSIYLQFPESIRRTAREMAKNYEIFYCLEKSIRELVKEKLQAEKGANWWDMCVPQTLKDNASKNRQREADSGVTERSSFGTTQAWTASPVRSSGMPMMNCSGSVSVMSERIPVRLRPKLSLMLGVRTPKAA